jgi:Flp pilus assembly protein TadG
MFSKLREKTREEDGYALVMMALSFSILLAFMGLAIDGGLMFQAKRRMQMAADAAATAGTLDYLYNGSLTSAAAAAKAASSSNGFTDTVNGVAVAFHNPPSVGPNAGSSSFFEAIVSQNVPTLFMNTVGTSTLNVQARGVAGTPTAGNACIWLMNATGADFNAQGSYTLSAPTCGIYMNSTSSNAVSVTGNGGTLNALYADAVGGSIGHQTKPTKITTYAAARTSPWGNLVGANPATGTGCTSTTATSGLVLTGTMSGPGAGNTRCYTKAVTLSNLVVGTGTLGTTGVSQDKVSYAAGTLVFGAGVTISGTVTIFGGTIDIAAGAFNQPSNTILNIVSPTSGTYNGIAIMEPATNTNTVQVQKGSNGQVLDGYIYAPGAQVSLQDNGGGIAAIGIVADNLNLGPSTITIPSYDAAHPSTTPNRVVTLVE